MSLKVKKVLRVICKIILILIGLGVVGYFGYFVYRSIAFKPLNVVVTNVTDTSATITWTTSEKMNGVVFYSKNNVIAGPLGFVSSSKSFDDRDVSAAQKACVEEFNNKAAKTKDSSFTVSADNYDCTKAKVTKMGSYYTHSITITDLDENATYNFVVGDGIWSFKNSVNNVKTFSTLDKVDEPKPLFGKVVGDDGTYSNDGLVYITFTDGSESKDSNLYSSTTNDEGGWYLDASTVRYSDGTVLPLELENDSFAVYAKYMNYGTSDTVKYVLGYFNGAYPDITVKKSSTQSNNVLSKYLLLTYAKSTDDSTDTTTTKPTTTTPTTTTTTTPTTTTTTTPSTSTSTSSSSSSSSSSGSANTTSATTVCPSCPSFMTVAQYNSIINGTVSSSTVSSLGYGNVAKALANKNGGTLDKKNLETALSGIGVNAGNVNALAGVTDGSNNKSLETCLSDSSCNVTVNRSTSTITQSYCSGTQTCTKSSGSAAQCSYVNNSCGYKSTSANATTTTCTNDTCIGGMVCKNNSYQYIDGKCGYSKTTPVYSDSYSTACGKDTTTSACSTYCSTHSTECKNNTASSYKLACGNNTSSESCSIYCKNHSAECITESVQCSVSIYYTGSTGTSNSCKITCDGKSINLTSMEKCKKVTGITDLDDSLVSGKTYEGTYTLSASEVNPFILSVSRIETFIDSSPTARSLALTKMNSLMDKDPDSLTDTEVDTWQKICKALGGSYYSKYDKCTATSLNIPEINIVSKAYAAEDMRYSYYLPEMGLYNFEIDGASVSKSISNGNSTYLFYVESNGKDGFQMPADPDNPTADEDIVLSSSAYEITYAQESTAQQYNIKKGINIISFNFMPITTDSGAYTAKDVINQAADNGVEIQYITTFNGGRWSSGYSCSGDTCTGTNFTVVPGVGYLVYATEDGTITIPGYNLSTSIPVAFSAGWNLVGVNGYTTAYTARTFIDSINTISGLTADNVTWWPTSKGKYEGIAVENGTQYGTDFSLSSTNGYFVRISKFAPSDTSCKSLIWQAGGTLNGTCGNTK